MPRGWELFHGRSFDNLYWHWAGSSSAGGDVPVNPTSGVIPYNNAGTFDDSNLLRRNTSTTDLRYLVDGTVNQLFRIYKTSDNGIASPTNYERIVITSEDVNNVFSITTEAGGTGSQRPINIGQASGANAVPVGINASPGALVAGRALQIGRTQATPTDDVDLYFEGVAAQSGDFIQANSPDVGGIVFRVLSNGNIAVNGGIRDVNQNSIIGFTPTAVAVNYFNITNAAANGVVIASAAGTDTDIQLTVSSKGADNLQLNAGSTGQVRFGGNIAATITDDGGGNTLIKLGSGGRFAWSNDANPNNGTVDCRLLRMANGVVRAAANSDGVGAFLAGLYVDPRTAANVTVDTEDDSGKVFTNEGAAAGVNFNLPGAAANNPAGASYTFYVQDADGITVTAAAGDTIRLAGSVSATAGNINSTTIGSSVTLVAINATEWCAISIVGTWTVT